jgi:hypothetical protein
MKIFIRNRNYLILLQIMRIIELIVNIRIYKLIIRSQVN